MQDSIRNYIKFLIVFYVFILIGYPAKWIVGLLGLETTEFLKVILETILSIITVVVVIVIYKKNLINDFKKVKKYPVRNLVVTIIGMMLGAYAVEVLSGGIVILLTGILDLPLGTSENNIAVEAMMNSAPVLMGINAVLLAPFNEENIFRLGFNEIIKNKGAFIAVSGITFGIMHVIDNFFVYITLPIIAILVDIIIRSKSKKKVWLSVTCIITYLIFVSLIYSISNHGFMNFIHAINLKEVLFSIEYISMGIYFAYMYKKYDNVYLSFSAHALINLNATILLSFM